MYVYVSTKERSFLVLRNNTVLWFGLGRFVKTYFRPVFMLGGGNHRVPAVAYRASMQGYGPKGEGFGFWICGFKALGFLGQVLGFIVKGVRRWP